MNNAIFIAGLHQKSIADKRAAIQADANCIRQLLVGRDVVRKNVSTRDRYRVTETRMNLSGAVEIRGKKLNKGRVLHIGTVAEIEIAP